MARLSILYSGSTLTSGSIPRALAVPMASATCQAAKLEQPT